MLSRSWRRLVNQTNSHTRRPSGSLWNRYRLSLEQLETRFLPSASPLLLDVAEVEPNNTTATATVLNLPTASIVTATDETWLTVNAALASSDAADFFKITVTGNAGVFFDIDSRDTGLSTSLDAKLEVLNSSGGTVGSNDDGYDFQHYATPTQSTDAGATPDPSLYLDLTGGTYFIRVTAKTGSGSYQLNLLADTTYSSSPRLEQPAGSGRHPVPRL